MATHTYQLNVTWTGNTGDGTATYRSYRRDSETVAAGSPAERSEAPGAGQANTAGPPTLPGSSDPSFRGDPTRWNPEQLLVASVAQCHLLWYLHLCAVNHVVVAAYTDSPIGVMAETPDGGGHFTGITLYPQVSVTSPDMVTRAEELHAQAHQLCFIANSVNFPITHQPLIDVAPSGT